MVKSFDYAPSVKFYGKGFLFAIESDADRIYLKKGTVVLNIADLWLYTKTDNIKRRLYMLNDDEVKNIFYRIRELNPKSCMTINDLKRIKDLENIIINFDKLSNRDMSKA